MADGNERTARDLYQAFTSGDMEMVDRLMGDDIVWHAPGRAKNSGVRRGKHELFAAMGSLAELTGGTLRAEVHDVLANEDHVVVLQRTLGEREGIGTLDDFEVTVMHVRDGKVSEVWEHPGDLYAMDAFFKEVAR